MQNRTFIKISYEKLSSVILLTGVLCSVFSVSAQTRRGRSAPRKAANKAQIAKIPDGKQQTACNGGWSGVITLTKTLNDRGSKDEAGIRGGKDRIIQEWSRDYLYEGKVFVDGSAGGGQVSTNANATLNDFMNEHGIEKVWDSCRAFNDEHWFVIDNKDEKTTAAKGEGTGDSFFLNVNQAGGTYAFSYRFPEVKGNFKREQHTRRSGHCQAKNNEPWDQVDDTPFNERGEVARIEDGKIDLKNPDVLTGSKTWDTSTGAVKSFQYTVAWTFRRCPPPLIITDVKFYEPIFPSPNSWHEIDPNEHTFDGNQVKIVATIVNLSPQPKTASVNFKELKENADLPEGKIQVNFEPRQEREVEYLWDTSGYAWKEANTWNQPETNRQIQVQIPDDAKTKDITVYPKPVVVIPGLWSKPESFAKLLYFFKDVANIRWTTDYARISVGKTAAENAPVIDRTVRDLQKKENAWHVDLVAHSTGGLSGRAYVHGLMPTQFDGKPTVAHLVMISTPNQGTPCAVGVENILTKIFNRSADSFREITIKNMRLFNQTVTKRNGTRFSVLVGNSIEPTCHMEAPGDGITPIRSAIWTIADWKYSTVRARHEEMPGEQPNFMAVYKWLAISPKGNHAPDNSTAALENPTNDFNAYYSDEFSGEPQRRGYGAMFRPAEFEQTRILPTSDDELAFSTGIKLAPSSAVEVEIPASGGSKMSIVLLAPPQVSATLIDAKGAIVGKNLADTPEANATFRTIRVERAFGSGKFKLKFESREQTESEIVISVFIDANPVLDIP
jgi:hypothetical protein